MAKLLKKGYIKNTKGELEELDIYTTIDEATISNEKYTIVEVEVEPSNILKGYIGLIEDVNTKKASSATLIIDGKEYKLRKYVGRKSFYHYAEYTYPSTYQTMTEIPELPDTSDGTLFSYMFRDCSELISVPYFNTKNGTTYYQMFSSCNKLTEIPDIDLLHIGERNAGGEENYNYQLYNMLYYCTSLKSVTFNNVPKDITLDLIRSVTGAPSTVEIILNYREA